MLLATGLGPKSAMKIAPRKKHHNQQQMESYPCTGAADLATKQRKLHDFILSINALTYHLVSRFFFGGVPMLN